MSDGEPRSEPELPMDTGRTPLFSNLDRALRKAYDRPLEEDSDGSEASLTTAEPDSPIPDQIGRYRVRGVIARGGMGAVLRAEDAELGRDVAIKVSRSRDPALLELFANEARICSQLQHPGIVPVYERGRTDDARPYYVMKLIEGETLATLLEARPSVGADAPRMIDIFTAVCQTMAYVHSRGFFHGDLKPGNIMVGAFGEVQVMDWGIAGESSPETTPGTPGAKRPLAVGTPAYMPPERARGDRDNLGIRSDVFSLGAILCEILTGDPPYRGSNRSEIYKKAVNAELGDALALLAGSGAEPAMIALAGDCLAVDPAKRPADAEAVAHRIADHVNALGKRAREAEIDLARAHARHASERRARRLTLALAAVLILGLVGGGIGFLMLREEKLTRQAEATRIVDEALVVAHQGLTEAKLKEPPDPERWAKAEAAAVRAVGLAERSSADQATIARARALLGETHSLRANRLRYLALQERIEDIEHHGLEEDRQPEWLDAAYREAFRENGIDITGIDAAPPAEEGARATLSLALTRWALARGRAADSPTRQNLLQAAMTVDPDPDRRELCSAFLAGDHDRLLRASRSPEALGTSPETWSLLSRFLVGLSHGDESTALLRAACAKFPGDFRVHHDLVARLGFQGRSEYDDVIRLLSTCVAIRPASSHALIDLGSAYHANEQLDLAANALEKATALQPAHSRGWIVLSMVRRDMGELDDAKQAADAAIGCETDADSLVRMAATYWSRGLAVAAESALKKAVETSPQNAHARVELGRTAIIDGRPEDAIVQLREAVDLAPKMTSAWYGLGTALAATMNVEDGRDALERALELGDKSADAALRFGALLLFEGSTDRALRAIAESEERAKDRSGDPAMGARLAGMRLAADLTSPAETVRTAETDSRASRAWDLAYAAGLRGWFRTSAALYERSSKVPALARPARVERARAAALAGRGFGSDLDESVSGPGLRNAALLALEDELADLRKDWESDHLKGPAVRRTLRGWIADGALPCERRADFVALPPTEKAAWTAFWSDVRGLLADLDLLVLPAGASVRQTLSAKALGVPGPLAGVQFAPDGATLYAIGSAGSKMSAIHAVPVIRDPASKAITGFGPARLHSRAEHADGGLVQVSSGTFYWSTWREHELGELVPGRTPKRFPLVSSGVPPGGGGLAFVPSGSRSGGLLMSSYSDGGIYTLELSQPTDGTRTPIPGSAVLVAKLPKGIEGIRFIPTGPRAGSLLVANWDAGVISLVDADPATGLPATDDDEVCRPRNFISGIEAASGLDFDPITGDLLVSGWGSGNRVLLLAGVTSAAK